MLMGMAKHFTLPKSWLSVSSEQVLLDLMKVDGVKGCGPMKAALARQLILQLEGFLSSAAGCVRGPGPSPGLAGLGPLA